VQIAVRDVPSCEALGSPLQDLVCAFCARSRPQPCGGTTAGAQVEVTAAQSNLRGMFVSVAGSPSACDAARKVLGLVDTLTFTDRDIDDEDPDHVVDFYAVS
jgi:hypothetical protein